jgi:DNA polymerase-3 subunit gamma/tau
MSEYQSLYRKYRSQTFADLVGQDAASRALQGAIISGRVAHAYLFSGSRGTGKTSAARLLAKALNCTGRPRDSAEPCNQCQSCIEMTAGAALDLIEIDAASNRGIDEIRDLREKVNLAPALGPKKIYIIDEAHMLTNEAFNALLKTLEEPPPHVVFVLCTTDVQKMPLTVIGRCQHFVFRRHGEEQIVARLSHIAKSEKVQVDPEAMKLIARTAQGSMRDAVGLLDQLVPLADGPITLDAARSVLGIADPRLLEGLLDDVLAGHAAEALQELERVYAGGAELRQVVRGLMESARDRLLAAVSKGDQASARRLSTVLDGLLHVDGEVRRHAEPRFLVEATLARLAVELGQPTREIEAASADAPSPPSGELARTRSVPANDNVAPTPSPVPVEGWNQVLEKMNRTVRAVYLDAQPEVDGGTLVLWFRYGFHHKKAQEQSAQLMPHVREWLGPQVQVDYRLREAPAEARSTKPLSPEDDPFVREVVRRFDGRVTKVKDVSE